MIPFKNGLPSAAIITTLVLAFVFPAFAGNSIRSKIVRFQPCIGDPPCIADFRLKGRFNRPGEKDYFRFYNDSGLTQLDLWVTDRTRGELPSGNGVRVVAYVAKKEGRRPTPRKLRRMRKLAGGIARLSPPRKDGKFAGATIPKDHWVLICLTPKVRGENGNYNIFFELEEVPLLP